MANIDLDGFVLRRLEEFDAVPLYKYRNDKETTQLLGGFSLGFSMSAMHQWVQKTNEATDRIVWAIAKKRDDYCVGHIGLYEIDHRIRKAQIGTFIGDRNEWGKGLGTSTQAAVLRFGFLELNLNRIESIVLEGNKAMLRIKDKFGFRQEGVLRDYQYRNGRYHRAILLSLLRAEWLGEAEESWDSIGQRDRQ